MTALRKCFSGKGFRRYLPSARSGYTLVELLMATTLSLMLLMGVVSVFATISASVSDARSILETADRLRTTKNVLQEDLAGLTVTMQPPRRPEAGEGYFELIEGPLGVLRLPWGPASSFGVNSQTGEADSTVADMDDIVMFTTRRSGRPFVGRFGTGIVESQVAEVAWFVRGHTLYRRVLLVAPQVLTAADANQNGVIDLVPDLTDASGVRHGYYELYDVSARPAFHQATNNLAGWVPNTLGDLTKRENRFAHWVHGTQGFPFDASPWGLLGLPLLHECSHPDWMTWNNLAQVPVAPHANNSTLQVDLWNDPHNLSTATAPPPIPPLEPITGVLVPFLMAPDNNGDGQPDVSLRVGEDVILTNVIGFDVKVWDPEAPVVSDGNVLLQPGDPGYLAALADAFGPGPTFAIAARGAYVDLNYVGNTPALWGVSHFSFPGDVLAMGPGPRPTRIYDTWSFHYEHDGIDQWSDGRVDLATNGFDDNGDGVVDDANERETRPPYAAPLRGIQVKIRVFEPDTKQVREVTVVQDFLPK